MLRKKSLLFFVGLIALVGSIAIVSFSDSSADMIAAPLTGNDQFDLTSALENAVSGNSIVLPGDAVLSGNAVVKPGVILDDGGFSLRIPADKTLSIEGTFLTSGRLTVDFRGSVNVAHGGFLLMNNEGNTAEISGSLVVYREGVFDIGLQKSSTFDCLGNGKLFVEGTMTVGYKTLNSIVNVRNGIVTGEVRISDGSSFKIFDSLTIGNAPILTTETENTASIFGKFIIDSSAYILVYGQSSFTAAENIKYPAASTSFSLLGNVYAAEYKDLTGKHAIVTPSTADLKDYRLINWKNISGNIITNASGIQIGSTGYTDVYGEVVKQTYRIVLAEDKSIKWVVNGIEKGSSWEETGVYGATYTISVRPAPGNTDLPGIFKDGVPYAAGTSFSVTGDITFTTSNNYIVSGKSMVTMLLIAIVILFAVLAMSAVALRIKATKKTK